jgi:diacylglycerol kinase family enzyme
LSLAEVLGYRPQALVLEANGERVEAKPFVVTFANGPQYGSGAVINPGARLDDGRLEVVLFDGAGSRLGILRATPRLFIGGIERLPRYRRLVTGRAAVTAESLLQIHRDGDPVAPGRRIEVDVLHRALDVVVPVATARDPQGPLTP